MICLLMGGDREQTPTTREFTAQRLQMVADQIENRGITDAAVLEAMRTVPRELFVRRSYLADAYIDGPLPIIAKQTISQPFVVAYMIAALHLAPTDRVLEIGTGSGYAAAVLSRIVQDVYTVERLPALADYARARLAKVGYDNIHIRVADGTLGWPEHAPYNGIVVAAGGPSVPQALTDQLAVGGRLVIPVGRDQNHQDLYRLTRVSETNVVEEKLSPVAFVPLIGEAGWGSAEEAGA